MHPTYKAINLQYAVPPTRPIWGGQGGVDSARYYAPPTFISRDPMFEKYPSISPYTYCANNPMKLVNPTGKKIVPTNEAGEWIITAYFNQFSEKSQKNAFGLHKTTRSKKNGANFSVYESNISHNSFESFKKGLSAKDRKKSDDELQQAYSVYKALHLEGNYTIGVEKEENYSLPKYQSQGEWDDGNQPEPLETGKTTTISDVQGYCPYSVHNNSEFIADYYASNYQKFYSEVTSPNIGTNLFHYYVNYGTSDRSDEISRRTIGGIMVNSNIQSNSNLLGVIFRAIIK